MRTMQLRSAVWLLSAVLSSAGVAAQERVRFSGLDWETRGEVRVEEHLGRTAARLRSGALRLDAPDFESGTIEFDVATSGHRSFLGVAFRFQADGSYEDFYLRPHNSGRFDAMQYTPVWHDVTAWQLYPEHNASFVIPRDRWLSVKLTVSGGRLEVFLDGSAEPTLVAERLRGPDTPGGIVLKAFFPGASEAPGFYPTAFSNVRVRRGGDLEIWDDSPGTPEPGTVTEWAVSQAFAGGDGVPEAYPEELIADASWRRASAEASGRTNLAKLGGLPDGESSGLKLARIFLASDRPRRVKLHFGFSDRGAIFLDGVPLYAGDNTYLSRSGRYLGVMTRDNDVLYLQLGAGEHELLFAIGESFGGWGLTARLAADDGLTWATGLD